MVPAPTYRRTPGQIMRGLANPAHYRSLGRLTSYVDPLDAFVRRYVLGRGDYPAMVRVRAPGRRTPVELVARSRFDMLTIHEIFVWRCYPAVHDARVVLDLGANAGISMAYFLAVAPRVRVIGVEPLTENSDQAADNLRQFSGRFDLRRAAVMDYEGTVELQVEPSGRYSGIDFRGGAPRTVACVDAERLVQELVDDAGCIDLLKIDIEGAERAVLERLSPQSLARVRTLAVEGEEIPFARLEVAGFAHRVHPSGVHWFSRP